MATILSEALARIRSPLVKLICWQTIIVAFFEKKKKNTVYRLVYCVLFVDKYTVYLRYNDWLLLLVYASLNIKYISEEFLIFAISTFLEIMS